MTLENAFYLILLILGFGFIIFWHELGHFLTAKWVGIRVEQFAVGFGQALISFRKGIGVRAGNTQKEYERRIREHLRSKGINDEDPAPDQIAQAGRELKLGETEYRLNWIPLGGYVKMLGQDDLNPNSTSEDPRSYNRKSVGARMIVVSAGVVMNIILAAIGFMILFRYIGHTSETRVIGFVAPGSPAQQAGVEIGDEVLTLNGHAIHNWTKFNLRSALLGEGEQIPLVVRRVVDGKPEEKTILVTPRKSNIDGTEIVQVGVRAIFDLRGPDPKTVREPMDPTLYSKQYMVVQPGDVITHVAGKPVKPEDYAIFDDALQALAGKPVPITIQRADGKVETAQVEPVFAEPFGDTAIDFAGLMPRVAVSYIATPTSAAKGRALPGDVVERVVIGDSQDTRYNPTARQLRDWLNAAGEAGQTVTLVVDRDGNKVTVDKLALQKLSTVSDKYGLGIALDNDLKHTIVGDVAENSTAAKAGIAKGDQILAVNGKPASNWHDIANFLKSTPANEPAKLKVKRRDGSEKTIDIRLAAADRTALAANRYTHTLVLDMRMDERKTDNLLTAAKWGATDTGDLILQFYLTLRRFADGNVSPKNAMGPVGIFHTGTHIAERGPDWLIWFLALISANLAVVNFLPIPIVDGGLFLFLIAEKIKGKPVSQRTQSIAQVLGLVLLLGIFIFVTYNDITRLF